VSRITAFFRHLGSRERLPFDPAPAPARRRGFLRTLAAREELPRAPSPQPGRRRGVVRWLVRFERLPTEQPAASPAAGDRAPERGDDHPASPEGAPSMEHAKHVFRVLIALVALIATYVLVRGSFVPKSFGRYGAYRYDNVAEQRDKPLVHGAVGACGECHQPVAAKHAGAKHATVPCEDCHAPLATHVRAGKRSAAMVKDPSYQLCVRCHRKLASRPAAVIKQVVPEEHVTRQGEKLAGNVCVGCHDPHSPQMGDDGEKKGGQP
jgi:hypothetical protein